MDQRDIDERIQSYYGAMFDEQARLTSAGLDAVSVQGVEGPAGMLLEQLPADTDAATRDAAAHLAGVAATAPGIRDFSGHLLAVGQVPGD